MFKVQVAKFQSVREPLTLEVSGFGVILGPSNRGKSAIIRAILAHLSNKSGTSFVSVGEKEAEVTLHSNGHQSIWKKSTSGTTYQIDGQLYEKIGRGNPPDTIKTLGLQLIQTADKRRWWPQIQRQFDPLFIIGEPSPTTTAELLGANEDALTLTLAIKIAGKEKSGIKAKEEALSRIHLDLLHKINTLSSYEDALLEKQAAAETAESNLTQVTHRLKLLVDLQEEYTLNNTKLAASHPLTVSLIPTPLHSYNLPALLGIKRRWELIDRRFQVSPSFSNPEPVLPDPKLIKLITLSRALTAVNKKLLLLISLSHLNIPFPPNLHYYSQREKQLQSLQQRYHTALNQESNFRYQLDSLAKELTDLERSQQELQIIRDATDVCPLCDAPLVKGKFSPESLVSQWGNGLGGN
jgi:hypothetical protein